MADPLDPYKQGSSFRSPTMGPPSAIPHSLAGMWCPRPHAYESQDPAMCRPLPECPRPWIPHPDSCFLVLSGLFLSFWGWTLLLECAPSGEGDGHWMVVCQDGWWAELGLLAGHLPVCTGAPLREGRVRWWLLTGKSGLRASSTTPVKNQSTSPREHRCQKCQDARESASDVGKKGRRKCR